MENFNTSDNIAIRSAGQSHPFRTGGASFFQSVSSDKEECKFTPKGFDEGLTGGVDVFGQEGGFGGGGTDCEVINGSGGKLNVQIANFIRQLS